MLMSGRLDGMHFVSLLCENIYSVFFELYFILMRKKFEDWCMSVKNAKATHTVS